MAEGRRLEVGESVAIKKSALDALLGHLANAGFQPVGPQVQQDTIVYRALASLEQLPQGYVTEQSPGRFRLVHGGHARYFDFIPAAQSWKQFLFPPRVDLITLRRNGGSWQQVGSAEDAPAYAFVGVRACELAAIQIQDRAFLRPDFSDPIYHARRQKVFILAVNCLHPAGTCFCASMSTGPRVPMGYDLCLTELDDVFLLQVGSELGRSVAADVPCEAASGYVLGLVEHGLEQATRRADANLNAEKCGEGILENLDSDSWQEVAARCLSCGNCTLVCPTCFCWDALDSTNLNGTETRRERVWDSCFNPAYSYQAGGNTRPTIKARYRQWLSHKFGTWKQQFGTSGCVGCGRCITWCPVGIDTRREVAALGMEADR
jgi:sulfhydrogenase subunit beta (sulfur reductase)